MPKNKITVTGSKATLRTARRQEHMPVGEQLEAMLDFAAAMKSQGFQVGAKMERMLNRDRNIRNLEQ